MGNYSVSYSRRCCKENGELTEICIGEKEDDPVFCITDLLPHLAAKQNERPLREGLKGEELNVVLGSLPYEGEDIKDAVKTFYPGTAS